MLRELLVKPMLRGAETAGLDEYEELLVVELLPPQKLDLVARGAGVGAALWARRRLISARCA